MAGKIVVHPVALGDGVDLGGAYQETGIGCTDPRVLVCMYSLFVCRIKLAFFALD